MSVVVGRIYKGVAEICSDGFTTGNNGEILDTECRKVFHNEKTNMLMGFVGYVDLYIIEWFKNYDKELNIIDLTSFCDEVISRLDQTKETSIVFVLMNLEKIFEINIYSDKEKKKIKYIINERKDFIAIGSAQSNAMTLKHFFLSPKSIVNQIIKYKMNAYVGGKITKESMDSNEFTMEDEI